MRIIPVTAQRAAVILLPVLMVMGCSRLNGQSVWPGDINNNGIVNGVDLLYHGVAEGQSGPIRPQIGTDWQAHTAATQWSGQYPGGLDYSWADVNGKGKVEQQDRSALWEDNYGHTHGGVIPDVYLTGDASTDPTLAISANVSSVQSGQQITFSLSLGDVNHPITNFFGIAFTLKFDPDHVADEQTKPLWDPEVVNLGLNTGNWLNPNGNDVESFIQLDNAAGELEVVIMRKAAGTVAGHGEIASVMTITEDIIFLEGDVNSSFTIDQIKLIDDNLVEYPVAGSTTTVLIEEGVMAVQAETEEQENTAAVAAAPRQQENVPAQTEGEEVPVQNQLSIDQAVSTATENVDVVVYPNPVVNRLRTKTNSSAEWIENITLYTANGQVLQQLDNVQASEAEMDVSMLPQGNYYLQCETNNGTITKMINK